MRDQTTIKQNHWLVIAALLPFTGCVVGEDKVDPPAVTTTSNAISNERTGTCTVTRVASTQPTCIDHDNTSGIANPAVITRVEGSGLPVLADGKCDKELINFFYSDSDGPGAFVLGCTDTGTWTVDLCSPPPGSYSFGSRVTGNGKYTHFADCSAP